MPTVIIDPDLSHYEPFFDDSWGQGLLDKTRESSLYDAAFALSLSWKSQSQAHSLPWILIESLKASWRDPITNPIGYSRRLVRRMREELLRKVSFTNMKRKEITAAMDEIVTRFDEVEVPDINMAPTWEGLCKHADFHTGLNGLMRDVFCTLYHDYENYVHRVVTALNGGVEVEVFKLAQLRKAVNEFLGQPLVELCVNDRSIEVPRLIRNCFAHAGGAEGDKLRGFKPRHNFPVDGDGILHVLASHNRELFGVLSKVVSTVTEVALSKLPASPPSATDPE